MTSQWFQPTIYDYQRPALLRWVGRWWWVAVLLLLGSGLLAWWDIRFLLTTFLLILVVIPVGIANLYLFNLLSPTLRSRLHYQQVEISSEEWVKVTYDYPPDPVGGEGEDDSESQKNEGRTKDTNREKTIRPTHPLRPLPENELIPWDKINSIGLSGSVWVIRFKKGTGIRPDFFVVPHDAVEGDISYPLYYD